MDRATRAEVRIFDDLDALSEAAAGEFIRLAREAVAGRARFTVSLAGGNSPRRLYEVLALRHHDSIDWSRVRLFWGDERCVPTDHPMSNYRMAKEALVSRVPIPPMNVHRIQAELEPPQFGAEAYEEVVRRGVESEGHDTAPVFDLMLLGMGADGHTASLFPGDAALAETSRWVMPATAPESYDPRRRITLTLPVINRARNVLFLVTGADKRDTLGAVLRDPDGAGARFPAAMVRPSGRLTWFVDQDAGIDAAGV
jgi:6-phosphogluconolactonase